VLVTKEGVAVNAASRFTKVTRTTLRVALNNLKDGKVKENCKLANKKTKYTVDRSRLTKGSPAKVEKRKITIPISIDFTKLGGQFKIKPSRKNIIKSKILF